MVKNWLISIVFVGAILPLWANTSNDKNQVISGAEGWIPNHGQIHNQRYERNSAVTHLWASGRGMNVQLRQNGLSYDTYSRQGNELQFHRLDMTLKGANPNTNRTEEDPFGGRFNFYGPGISSGVSVNQFRSVVMHDVYPGIDVVCSVSDDRNAGVKYDFVVSPGSDLDQVKMEYEGFDDVVITDDEILFELSGRTLSESIPESWITPGKRKATIRYRIIEQSANKLVVGLEWENAQDLGQDEKLIVDPIPVLHWGTYYGDTLPDAGTALVTDTIGKVYIAGHTQSLLTIATNGAHQQNYAGGGSDAYLAKYNAHGQRSWSTYFGGTGDDRATGVAVDGSFELYLVGNTDSADDSLATDSAYQEMNAGGTDVFAAKFDSTGVLLWNTFLGGSGNDTATACVVDTSGHVFIGGYSESGDWLETPQFAYAGGMDAFVVKLDAEGMPVWSTYYGGSDDDYVRSVAVDSLDYLFLTGSTFSSENIATDNTHQSIHGGEEDAFAVCFNPDGSRKWATYFGGSENEVATGIETYYDAVYVTGYTQSAEAIADSLSFQPEYSGAEDAFLLRLDSLGNRTWSTYFGDTLMERAFALAVDIEGYTYITGVTNSENSLSTQGVHQDWLRGDYEGFIAKFDSAGSRVWGTYYGGFNYEELKAIDVFGVTAIYITGFTFSEYFVAYYGEDIEYNGNSDSFLARLDMERPTGPSGICFGGGGGGGTGGGGGSGGGGGTDEVINEFVMCSGDSLQFSIVGGALNPNSHWVWYQEGCGGDGVFEAIGGTVWLSPEVTTTYYVRAESGSYYTFCKDFTLIVVDPPVAEIEVNDTLLCAGDSLHLSASSGEYYNYHWSGPVDFTSDEQQPIIDSLTAQHSGWYVLEIVNAPDCYDVDSVWIEIMDYPEYEVTVNHPNCAEAEDGSILISYPDSAGIHVVWPGTSNSLDSLSGLGEGSYSAYIHADGFCSAMISVELTAPPSPIDSVVVTSTTCGEDNGAVEIFTSDSVVINSYDWVPNESQGPFADNLAAGDYEITVGDAEECYHDVSVTVEDSEGVTGEWQQVENVTCPGGSDGLLEILATGNSEELDYLWSTNDSVHLVLDSLMAGDYSVTITDSAGCSASFSATISEPEPVEISAEVTPEICENGEGSIALTALNDSLVQFIWEHNQDTTAHLQNLAAGTYSVLYIDSAGCSDSASYVVTAQGELSVEIVPDFASITEGDSVDITTTTEISPDTMMVNYYWEPADGLSCSDCPDPTASPDSTTNYTLTVISDQGCEATGDLLIEVEKLCPKFFVPDIFSPNADGHNDEWCVFGDCIETLQLQVFNRWGELIFESNDQDHCWDGTFKGAPVPSGSLVYAVRAVLEKGETIVESGNLTIRK